VIKKHFRPEFINRLDEIIVFNRLEQKELAQILELNINDLRQRLSGLNLTLDFKEPAKKQLLASLETTVYGARPLKRRLEQTVENKIASLLISDIKHEKSRVVVDLKNDEITVSLA
jgi:ATP-dependent Clp protease ATP-binding subunit ClpA